MTVAADLVFEDPPPIKRGGERPSIRVWVSRVEPLRQRPGEWACIHTAGTQNSASVAACRLNKGEIGAGIDATEFEFVSRGEKIYGRFVGGERGC